MESGGNNIAKLKKILKRKQSTEWVASQMGVSVSRVNELKQILREQNNGGPDDGESYRLNLDQNELSVCRMYDHAPTPEEVIIAHNIDTSKWRLSQIWIKQKRDGYLTSANFAPVKNELSLEVVLSEMKDVFSGINIKIRPRIKIDKTNKKALFVYTSDKHVAAMTMDNAMYGNKYSGKEFEVRMYKVYEEILNLHNIHGVFDKVVIVDLGDSLDGLNGYTTRGGHKLPQNMTNKEAFNKYISVHRNFFDDLLASGAAKNYEFIAQTNDNHSGDFGYMCNQAVMTYLNTAYPYMPTTITDKFIDHTHYGNHTILLSHGKDMDHMKNGLPLMLNDKTENYINKYIDYNSLSGTIHFIKGDLHQNTSQDSYSFRYRNVLSLYGSSAWVQTNFGPTRAGCSFDIYEKDTDRVFEHRIFFNNK